MVSLESTAQVAEAEKRISSPTSMATDRLYWQQNLAGFVRAKTKDVNR